MSSNLPTQLTKKDLIDEEKSQLLHGGINFYVEYIGSIQLVKSIVSISPFEQQKIGQTCIERVLFAAQRISDYPEINSYPDFFNAEKPHIYNGEVEMNVSAFSVMLIHHRILHNFAIEDISLIVCGTLRELNNYFCLIATVNNSGEISRRCFIFYATEMRVICNTIENAFNVCFQQIERIQEESIPVPNVQLSCQIEKTPSNLRIDQNTMYETANARSKFYESLINDLKNSKQMPIRSASEIPLSWKNSDDLRTPKIRNAVKTQNIQKEQTQRQFDEITRNLTHEPWFHGKLKRSDAETLIVENGHFLVRQSPNINGQIVLSGMQDQTIKHIFLVDQQGFLKTSKGEFQTVSQLINFYHQSNIPVTSDNTELSLIEPVICKSID